MTNLSPAELRTLGIRWLVRTALIASSLIDDEDSAEMNYKSSLGGLVAIGVTEAEIDEATETATREMINEISDPAIRADLETVLDAIKANA